jgi:hypothetical protein
MNIGFWVLDLSCLQLYFCFANGAERSGAEVCISVCCVIVPATMTWNEVAILQRFCLVESVSHNSWMLLHNHWMWLLSLNMARMLLTLFWDMSAYLHMSLCTVIEPEQSTERKCVNTHKLLEGGMNIGFWVFDLSCLQLYFCFAICAERCGAESCINVCCVIVPATMTWNQVAIKTAILFVGERFAQYLIGLTCLLFVVVTF